LFLLTVVALIWLGRNRASHVSNTSDIAESYRVRRVTGAR
jgi:hypothetical protein